METKLKQVIRFLNHFKHKVNIVDTGHYDYKRGFIIRPDGCTIGRITIYRGEYHHTKWYWKCYGCLIDSDFIIFAFTYYNTTGEFLSQDHYVKLVIKAENERKCDLTQKQNWRSTNPKTKGSRPKLQGKSLRSLINGYLREEKCSK